MPQQKWSWGSQTVFTDRGSTPSDLRTLSRWLATAPFYKATADTLYPIHSSSQRGSHKGSIEWHTVPGEWNIIGNWKEWVRISCQLLPFFLGWKRLERAGVEVSCHLSLPFSSTCAFPTTWKDQGRDTMLLLNAQVVKSLICTFTTLWFMSGLQCRIVCLLLRTVQWPT